MTITETETVYCANEAHEEAAPAIVRVRWLNGRFHPTAACAECLDVIMSEYVQEGAGERHPVLIDPITTPDQATGYERPRVVCLCGSTRYVDVFNHYRKALTEAGEIVLSIEIVTTQAREDDPQHADPDLKARLDQLHRRKIDLADYCLVVSDATGYFGDSTRGEIDYAVRNGRPVEFTNSAARRRAYELELI